MPNPLVTIVTPSLNSAKTIRQTLRSIAIQDHPEIEHLVIDGGSTDGTVETVKEFAPRSQVISFPGKNQSEALNEGFRLARGSFVGWLNSDDLYFDRHVVTQALLGFETNPVCPLVYGDAVYMDPQEKIVDMRVTPRFSFSRLVRYSFIPQPTIFVRTEVSRRLLINEELEFVMDAEWFLRIAEQAEFTHIPRFQAVFRCGSPKTQTFGRERYVSEVRRLRESYSAHTRRVVPILDSLSDKCVNLLARVKGQAQAARIGRAGFADMQSFLRP